ncbi:MAG TPA: DUF3048 domain-containing protein [Verrucomicrobiae bacterium]|nr:DUF3048 domain-containing protein [Verrucomicrobiae bacterium]
MDAWLQKIQALMGRIERFRWQIAGGAVLLVLISCGLFWFAVSGFGRPMPADIVTATSTEPTTTVAALVPRRLDGVLVPAGEDAFAPRAVMVENHPDARPLSGLSKANVVIEAPVEGGITRFMALFDATTTVSEVGPVRSARPYYVEWAQGWHASYFHVGGSPDALALLASFKNVTNIDQFYNGDYFWRDANRFAPHNVYTKNDLMDEVLAKKQATGTESVLAWHFQDMATSTDRGTVDAVNIPYGGLFNVSWTYDKDSGLYTRKEAGSVQKDRDGSIIQAANVVVIRTDSKTLDSYGRLQIRTTGSGDAIAYRDGKKFPLRWTRDANDVMRFSASDGSEFILDRGVTWIEVTTDDLTFSGVSQ